MKEKWRIVFTLLMLIVNIPLPLMLYYNNSSLFIILCFRCCFKYCFGNLFSGLFSGLFPGADPFVIIHIVEFMYPDIGVGRSVPK